MDDHVVGPVRLPSSVNDGSDVNACWVGMASGERRTRIAMSWLSGMIV